MGVVRPYNAFVTAVETPPCQRLASHEWAKHARLDVIDAATVGNRGETATMDCRLDHECIVAACFHSEMRSPQTALEQWLTGARQEIERCARGRREQQPRTTGRVIERQAAGVHCPVCEVILPLHSDSNRAAG